MRYIIPIILIFISFLTLPGQIQNNCSYNTPNSVYETINLDPKNSENLDALALIRRMLKPIGLEANFIPLKINGFNNCAAITKNGLRLIVYDELFLQALNSFGNTDWIKVSVFAHELGHHLNGHVLHSASQDEGRLKELQADEFSGFLLQKLGATVEQAKAGINIVGEAHDSESHPSKDKRLYAIEKGYKKAQGQENELLNQQKPNAEKYYIDAVEMYYQLLDDSNDFTAASIKNRVNSAKENVALDKILENLSACIKINPVGDDIYVLRSFVRFLQHNVEGAERDLSEALRLNPTNYLAYYKISEIESEKGDYNKALLFINKGININPNLADFYLHKGIILSKMGKDDDAIEVYNKAIAIPPQKALFYYNRGFSSEKKQVKTGQNRSNQVKK